MDAGPILLINGHDSVRAMLRAALEDEGYRVVLAARGEGAAVALRERPAPILLDADEPPEEGPLCAEASALRTPVVALSGAEEPHRPGVGAWLAKPFDLDDLYELARRWAPNAAGHPVDPTQPRRPGAGTAVAPAPGRARPRRGADQRSARKSSTVW